MNDDTDAAQRVEWTAIIKEKYPHLDQWIIDTMIDLFLKGHISETGEIIDPVSSS